MNQKKLTKTFFTETDTLSFSGKLAQVITEGLIIFLYGSLGAGKTTFARGFLQGFGYEGKVKSPTYTLVEPYDIDGRQIFHFDLFRLEDANELEYIGIHEYFFPSAICLIEWPEKGFPLLPPPDLACYIFVKEGKREFNIQAHSLRGETVLNQLV